MTRWSKRLVTDYCVETTSGWAFQIAPWCALIHSHCESNIVKLDWKSMSLFHLIGEVRQVIAL